MLIFFNGLGFLVGLVSLLVVLGFTKLAPSVHPRVGYILFGVLVFMFDAIYRVLVVKPSLSHETNSKGLKFDFSKHWLSSGDGVSLMFLPGWLFGIVFPIMACVFRFWD